MRPPFLEALLRTSSSEVLPRTSNFEPDVSVATPREHSGRIVSSLDESTNINNTAMMPSSGYIAHG